MRSHYTPEMFQAALYLDCVKIGIIVSDAMIGWALSVLGDLE